MRSCSPGRECPAREHPAQSMVLRRTERHRIDTRSMRHRTANAERAEVPHRTSARSESRLTDARACLPGRLRYCTLPLWAARAALAAGADTCGADVAGADMRGASMRGASMRGGWCGTDGVLIRG